MKTLRISNYTVTSWAEKLEHGWQGLASVNPKIPNTWSGGPTGDSLICDGVHSSAEHAESAALEEAVKELSLHLERLQS